GLDSDAGLGGLTGCYTLASGETNDTVDAGFWRPAAIGDRVWLDANANGQQDAGEAGVAGVAVELYACIDGQPSGSALAATTTDANGNYGFTGLKPGDYVVKFITPAGYSLSPVNVGADGTDSDAGMGGFTGCYTLASGETNNTVDAGLYQGAAIGDRVWEDSNANGRQDAGEAGIAGATVRLYTCVDGAPGTLVATATTDASGNYAFSGLVPGQYVVAFETPAGYQLSSADVGADDGLDSDAGLGGLTGCYTLASGETNDTVDAGFWRPAAIGDRVWLDANANGQQDAGEAGVAGVTVELYACVDGQPSGGALAATTTDADGHYAFTGLVPGHYVVKFVTPTGYSLSPVDVGADGSDSDAALSGFTGCYTLASGETNNTVDAGLYQGAAIGDRVWEDSNANGQQDAGEAGIAGATVRLYTCVDGVPDTLVATATTDASGNYAFSGLVPGHYVVAFETPNGYTVSTADVGADDGLDSDAGLGGLTGCYTLASGETNNTVDAGFWRPAAIGDRVWLDANANGQQDAGEAGVAGVEVELYTCIDGAPGVKVGASTFTDAAGNYSFTGLKPGDYLVKFITPSGFFLTNQNVGANDAADSDADATTGFTGCYKLEAGETDNSADAGIFKLGDGGVVPSIDLVKLTNGTDNNAPTGPYVPVGSTATFQYLVTNDGMVALSDIVLSDDHGTPGDTSDDFTPVFIGGDADGDGLLDIGETWIYEASTVVSAGQYTNLGTVTGTPVDADGNPVPSLPQPTDTDVDNHFGARVAIDIEKFVRGVYQETGGGGEGLTPGFWKTHSQYGPAPLAGWPETGYAPDDAWEAIFGIDVPGAPTLLDALNAAGGGLDALLRHSSAALLNAAQPNVDYAYSPSQVISLTRDAILSGDLNRIESVKDQFVMQNELGADLSTPASGGGTVTTPWFDADAPGTGPFIALGGTAEFRYEVRNTGDVALEGVSVSDDRLSGLSFEGGDTDHDGLLDLGEVWVYRGSELVDTASVDIVNVGTANGSALGITATDADAARYSTAALTQSLGDFVWLDGNRNGLQDNGEKGIGGLLVTLTGGGADGIIDGVGDTTATTSTDADGYYQFDNLAAGVQYQVTFGKPAGTAFTMRDAGADDAIDSDAGADGKSQIITLSPGQHDPSLDAGVFVLDPGIDLEKTTGGPSNANPTAPDYDNEDTPDGAGVPILTAGSSVTWTYKLTNTGNVDFAKADLAIVDDNGTPTNAADDMSIANGKIAYVSGDDGDNVLEAGESWLYEARGTVQPLGTLGAATTVDFSGNSAIDGTDGNTRSYAAGGVTVQANAWSRTKGSDTWQKAWVGAYDGGLGVTDSSESGSGSTHTVDNYGRDNYIVFQFSQDVVVDKAFLGYVVGDSDMTVYVGSTKAPITAMNNAVLAGMSLKEFNDTGSTSARWADFNAGDVQGNVLILAARDDGHSTDYFKVEKLVFQAVESGGVYANTATVTAPGGLSDSDMSHYESVPKIVAAPKFFVVDQGNDLSYQYAEGGSGLGSFALANTDPRDIAANADGSLLWVLDRDKNVEVYKGDGTQLGQWKAYGLGTEPEGITLDGKDLWMADRAGKLYWYDNAATRTSGTDSPESSFTLSLAGNLKGIVTDGTYLWAVTEGGTDYVYRFKILRDGAGDPSGLSASGVWKLATANAKPTGITLDPTGQSSSLWIVDEASDTVYEYGGGRGLTSGTGTVSASFKLSAGNTAPQGIADPLPAGTGTFDLADASAYSDLGTILSDPYAGSTTAGLVDAAIGLDDVGLVGTSAENAGTLALLHA
ncbi:SdrD B-like domain-containing protein, partial [Thauera aminoaromatica]